MKHQLLFVLVSLLVYQACCEYAPQMRNFVGKSNRHEGKSKSKIINETLCQEQLDFFIQSFRNNEIWALELFDSWSKIQSGMFSGSRFDLGDYDQCVRFSYSTEQSGLIRGKQCYVMLIPKQTIEEHDSLENGTVDWRVISRIANNLSATLINSICMPASCSSEQVVDFMRNDFQLLENFNVDGYCDELKEFTDFSAVDKATVSVFTISILLMVSSTIYDLWMHRVSKEPNKLLTAFSVYTNGSKLFDMTESKSSINSLHGLRAISIIWIMFGHRVTNQLAIPYRNFNTMIEFHRQLYSVIVFSYSIAVDTFFLMGGLLLAMSTIRAIEKNNLNILRMILHRYLRYTPVLGVSILCAITLPKYLADGPLSFEHFSGNCEKNWLPAIFHVQNYVNPDKLCLNHTWYLSVDFQLFILTPFLIYGIKKNRWLMLLIPFLIILCSIYIFVISMEFGIHKLPRTPDEGEIYHRWIYHPTHARIQSWLIGVGIGFILHENRNEKMKINRIMDMIMLIISLGVIVFIILSAYTFSTPYVSLSSSLLSNAIYMSLHRIGWALALAYVIFTCENQRRGSILRWFLSHPYWKPLGTMGLSLYITHVIYLMLTIMNQRQITVFSFWTIVHIFWGDLFPCIAIAVFFYLAFETPYLLIENYFYKKITKSEQQG